MFENVNHPIKDGIIADNSTLSSRKIKEMVENATELPTPAAGDNGKVLTVNSDLKYDLEAVPIPETPVLTYQSQGLTVASGSTSGTLICGTLKEKDLANAFSAGKIVRIIASPFVSEIIEITIDSKKIVIHPEDVYVFDIISRSENAGGAKYYFESRFGYNHPQSGDTSRNLKGIVRMYFTSNLTKTSAGTTFTVSFDVDGLKSRT